ncbi:MAG: ABC transporter permease [Chloroflexota bacterium]
MSEAELKAKPAPRPVEVKAPQLPPLWQRVWRTISLPILSIFTALVLGAMFIVLSDVNVLATYQNFPNAPGAALRATWDAISLAYGALFTGSVVDPATLAAALRTGDPATWSRAIQPFAESLVATTPYIFAGLALALGFRCGLFNIGAEGQLFVGALASVWVGYSLKGLPAVIHLPLALGAGAIGGAIWAGIPGLLKAKTGAHEVITTIMMNYIAFRLSDYLITGPMKRPGFVPVTPFVQESARLLRFFSDPNIRLHAGFLLALGMAVLVWWFLFKTTLGFGIRTVGANPNAARYAGISVTRNYVFAMALSGALAGLAGTVQVLGVDYWLGQAFSSGYGFDSIALALLGKSHPLGVVLAALLFGTLRNGATRMQSTARIPVDIISIVQALVIMFIAAPAIIRAIYRVRAEREIGEAVFTRGWGK